MSSERTSDKIKNSPWKKNKIMELLKIPHRVKFSEKLKYNDWSDEEIKILKKNKVIE